MAVPARRTSKTKKRMRRTHLKKEVNSTTVCPNCKAVIQPHRACTECGYYKGKDVLAKSEPEVKEEKPAKEKKAKKEPKKESKKEETK